MQSLPALFIQSLHEEPLLLLFLVGAIGYLLGQVRYKGASLGVAAVLFVGLAFGALDPKIGLPPIIVSTGLVLFVYSVGLSSGPGFFASFSRHGLRDNLLVLAALLLAALLVAIEQMFLRLPPAIAAGIYTGALTNTPALASLINYIANTSVGMAREVADTLASQPVVGYSVSYPMGVLGPIAAILLVQKLWRIDYPADARRVRDMFPVEQEFYNRTVCVTNPAITGKTIKQLTADNNWKVVFGRLKHNQSVELASGLSILDKEDLVSLIGTPEDVDAAAAQIGEVSGEQLELDRSEYDFRRIFVSNLDVAGRKLSALRLPQTYGAIVTRVRRGDIELLAHSNLVLELGDRVRVVAPRPLLKALSDFFGDSYRALSELNLFSLGLGIGLGIVIGMIPIPLPGGIEFKLGTAGGPLLVALVLGALHRTGRLVWTIPYSANLTIRQLGLTMLLAGIGTRSGYTFLQTLSESGGWSIFLSGALISLSTAFFMLWVGYKWLKIPFGVLTGMTAAVHTQPAVQGFAVNQAGNDLPNHGYALAFPMATIAKIIIAQALMALLK